MIALVRHAPLAFALATTTVAAAAPPQPSPSPSPDKKPEAGIERAPDGVPPLELSLDGGMAVMGQRFHSNGESRAGRLASYDFAAEGLAARVAGRHSWSVTGPLRLGLGGFYRYAGLTGVNAPAYAPDGTRSNVRLGLQAHQASAFVSAGVRARVLGGLAIDGQVGPALFLNYVETDPRAPLPSDRTVGLLTGLRVAAPRLFAIAERPLGLALEGSWMGLGFAHDQTPNLEDGMNGSSTSLLLGAEIAYGLFPAYSATQLAVTAGYQASIQTMTYDGSSARNGPVNGNVSESKRIDTMHVAALGLRLSR